MSGFIRVDCCQSLLAFRNARATRALHVSSSRLVASGTFRACALEGGWRPFRNPYLMKYIAVFWGLEVRVAATREATVIGTALDELASRWQSEVVYYPRIAGWKTKTIDEVE